MAFRDNKQRPQDTTPIGQETQFKRLFDLWSQFNARISQLERQQDAFAKVRNVNLSTSRSSSGGSGSVAAAHDHDHDALTNWVAAKHATFGTITNSPDIDQDLLQASTPTFAALLLPGGDIGSTTSEIGDVFLADDKKIYFGSDQDSYIEFNSANSRLEFGNLPTKFQNDVLIQENTAGQVLKVINFGAGDIVRYEINDGAARSRVTINNDGDILLLNNGDILPASSGGSNLGSVTAELGDVFIADDKLIKFGSDQDFTLGYNSTTGALEINTLNLSVHNCLHTYIDIKERQAVWNIHGELVSISTANALDAVPTDINDTIGLGKVVVVIIAGSDVSGTITVTGTTVDRDTGAETGADTDVLTVDTASTDNSGTDSGGNVTYAFVNAYITTKWFKGAIVLSTTNLTLTDVDIYQCSFEQLNDTDNLTINTFDTDQLANHTNANIYWHLYSVKPVGDKVTIALEKSMELVAADVAADKRYRLRRGALAISIDGSTEGFFVQCYPEPLNNLYWEDINCKIWWN